MRRFVVGDYVIAYRVDGDNVLILRVLLGTRDIKTLFRDSLGICTAIICGFDDALDACLPACMPAF